MAISKLLNSSKEHNIAVEEIIKGLIKTKILDSIIIPKRTPEENFIYQVIHKTEESLVNTVAFTPILPVNTATLLAKLTKFTPTEEKVGVILKPCEMRAVVEMVKLKQINLENIYLLTVDCNGTFDIEFYSKENNKADLEQKLFNSFKEGTQIEDIRQACKLCNNMIPTSTSDIGIEISGNDSGAIVLTAYSEKGGELLNSISGLEDYNPEDRQKKIEAIINNKIEIKENFLTKFKDEVSGVENLTKFFSKCINCHNCMSQCPICICQECFFESSTFDYESEQLLSWADRQGVLKMPTDTLLFQLGRMNHMITSCVACGMCSQACPVGIDVGSIFLLTAKNAQAVFDYEAGRSFEDEIPISTFREDELKDLGE